MPLEDRSTLMPGETLENGEYMESPDGRFRLRLYSGSLDLIEYLTDYGVHRVHAEGLLGADAQLKLTILGLPPNNRRPAISMTASNGRRWAPAFSFYSANIYDNAFFALQDDGNFVHYIRHMPTGDLQVAWAPGTDGLIHRDRSIPPNRIVVEADTPGSLIIRPRRGEIEIYNDTRDPISVRDETRVESIAPEESMEVDPARPGQLVVKAVEYRFSDLTENRAQPELVEFDAIQSSNSGGGRQRIAVSRGGRLSLQGLFARNRNPDLRKLQLGGRASRGKLEALLPEHSLEPDSSNRQEGR